jgi:hypothetical protein
VFTRAPCRCFIVVGERELDVKRLGEVHHHVQRQLLRVCGEPCGDLAGVWSGRAQELIPGQRAAPSLVFQEAHELGRRAGTRRSDAGMKRREQAHHASESRARRRARQHPSEVARLHAGGPRQLGESHASRGHPRTDRRQ